MKIVSISDPEERDQKTLCEQLVNRLNKRGQVTTVLHPSYTDADLDSEVENSRLPIGSSPTYRLTDTGWIVTGNQMTINETLEHLSPKYDFVILIGFNEPEVPHISLGDSSPSNDSLASHEDAAAATVDDIVARIDNLEPFETLTSLVSRAKASSEAEKAGAIATFTGRVRAKEHDDDVFTQRLEFEQYDEVAADRFETIREELEEREGVFEVLMHHRTGIVEYGEDIVFVVILAGHRSEAFQTVEDGINRLKDEVPLFKKEITVEDEFWAHE